MTTTDLAVPSGAIDATAPAVIVSSDCHIGPRLVEDLRPYCPAALLDDFDAYVASDSRSKGRYAEPPAEGAGDAMWRNLTLPGHHDPEARRADLDADGIAAEVVFHGSQNGEPIPFQSSMLGAPERPDLAAAGLHIYNRWLADVSAQAPGRHVGLAHLPMWDVDAAVAELEWAAGAGLGGVNFPALRPGIRRYNDPVWEPFWAAAASLRMPLTTHSGAGDPEVFAGAETVALLSIESGGWFSRRAVHLLVFAGVFERHPGLQLVMTEQPGEWWPAAVLELDSVHRAHTRGNRELAAQVPRPPSEYLHEHVWIGGSFLSRAEAEGAIRDGYADRVMWGADYPHMEGTFQRPIPGVPGGEEPHTPQSLRFTFAGLPLEHVAAMVGGNAVRCYGLDGGALAAVARRIGAPSLTDLVQPIDAPPRGASPFAFRTSGPWD
jgi:predicted TIM-barrel fold metal-dependent hydrolase